MPEIAWGKVVGPQFKNKVIAICGRLGCDPSHLTSSIAFETGESFAPDKINRVSGATGLIQFMPSTARSLGTTTAALAQMSAADQLDYVERYFQPYRGKMATISDATVLFKSPSPAYQQNKGLDANNDGQVTKAEAAAKVVQKLTKGLDASRRG